MGHKNDKNTEDKNMYVKETAVAQKSVYKSVT